MPVVVDVQEMSLYSLFLPDRVPFGKLRRLREGALATAGEKLPSTEVRYGTKFCCSSPSHRVLTRLKMAPETLKSLAAPATYKQPSRKGKKAWRKNVDVSDVQAGLEEAREEVIKHGFDSPAEPFCYLSNSTDTLAAASSPRNPPTPSSHSTPPARRQSRNPTTKSTSP